MHTNTKSETGNLAIFDKTIELTNYYTKQNINFNLKINGDKIIASKIEGNINFYKEIRENLENKSWIDGLDYLTTINIPFSIHMKLSFIGILERLATNTIDVPKRANYLRTILLELERIASHSEILLSIAKSASYLLLANKLEQIRILAVEIINDIISKENSKKALVFGGLAIDLTGREIKHIHLKIDQINKLIKKEWQRIRKNPLLKGLFQEVGFISRETAKKLSLVGPMARSTGIMADVRKTDPYEAYNDINFEVIVSDYCDLYGEILVRYEEIIESTYIIRQLLNYLPIESAIVSIEDFQIPSKSIVYRMESPSGELFSFALSQNGSLENNPKMYQLTPALFVNQQGILSRITGEIVDTTPFIFQSIGEGWDRK